MGDQASPGPCPFCGSLDTTVNKTQGVANGAKCDLYFVCCAACRAVGPSDTTANAAAFAWDRALARVRFFETASEKAEKRVLWCKPTVSAAPLGLFVEWSKDKYPEALGSVCLHCGKKLDGTVRFLVNPGNIAQTWCSDECIGKWAEKKKE